jgi:hypothetical protein
LRAAGLASVGVSGTEGAHQKAQFLADGSGDTTIEGQESVKRAVLLHGFVV